MTVADHKPTSRHIARRHPDDYRAWLHSLFARAQRAALDRFDGPIDKTERSASRLAELQLQALCEEEGGDDIYLPARDKTQRNAEIRRRFIGAANADELMAEFSISRTTLYRIAGQRCPAPENPISPLKTGRPSA